MLRMHAESIRAHPSHPQNPCSIPRNIFFNGLQACMTDSDTTFLEAADSIAARPCRNALWYCARCNWLGDSMEFVGGQWAVAHRAFGPELYAGTSGVALFLDELFRLAGERLFRLTAEGGARCALSRLEDIPEGARVGFYSGHAGI